MAARGQGCSWSTLVIAWTDLLPGKEVGGTWVADKDVLPPPSRGRIRQTKEGKLRIDFFPHLCSEKEQDSKEGRSPLPGHTPLSHIPTSQVYIATSARGEDSRAS